MMPVVLPAQYLLESGRYLVEPQKRLMLAVLQTVVDDYRGAADEEAMMGGGGPSERKAALRAAAYVSSKDRSWPFSFESICETIGLDAERLRQGLIRMARLRQQTILGLEDRASNGTHGTHGTNGTNGTHGTSGTTEPVPRSARRA